MSADKLEEYKQCANDMRNLRISRFAMFSVFAVITGGFMAFASKNPSFIIHISGLVLTIVFEFLHERVVWRFKKAHERAIDLEKKFLKFDYYSRQEPNPGLFSMRFVTRIMFIIFCVIWILLLFNCVQINSLD